MCFWRFLVCRPRNAAAKLYQTTIKNQLKLDVKIDNSLIDFLNDFMMIFEIMLGWFWDYFKMILGLFYDDFGMILGWFWDEQLKVSTPGWRGKVDVFLKPS